MVKTFHDQSHGDAHGSFQKWRQGNETGFFIKCKTDTLWMRHLNCGLENVRSVDGEAYAAWLAREEESHPLHTELTT